ncbi:MAG: hypothetical protein A2W33_04355 [Chloroflexi bacterium RBG_16_52_11]|nr:MAG: hypothetical protein A2W33_04355 [Chloroflexi bacterium RBG_16_52_11]
MSIAGMLRVRNEGLWIDRVIESILPVCKTIHVLDDRSEDRTMEICRTYSEVCLYEPPVAFVGLQETRDKNWLLSQIGKTSPPPEWVLHIDGDEVLEESSIPELMALSESKAAACSFRIWYLWSEQQIRTDGVYGRYRRPSMFRYVPGQFFEGRAGNGLHCGSVPRQLRGKSVESGVVLWHLGYMFPEIRLKKYAWYNEVDPKNQIEDCYRHMVQGDLPEVPIHAKLKHAGPLKLEPANTTVGIGLCSTGM